MLRLLQLLCTQSRAPICLTLPRERVIRVLQDAGFFYLHLFKLETGWRPGPLKLFCTRRGRSITWTGPRGHMPRARLQGEHMTALKLCPVMSMFSLEDRALLASSAPSPGKDLEVTLQCHMVS